MKTMKKAMSILLAVVMLIAMLPTGVFAAHQDEFADFPTGWSKVAMEAAVDNGLLNGFVDGAIKPQASLTRAEMAAIITRAFNAKTKADISAFVDVNPDAWYYDYIAKAVKMGALNGKSSSMMYPDTPITREEVFTAVARVLVLSSDNTSALNRYNDKGDISAWALKSMSALAERGYVNGDDLGNAKPKANITREEFAQFMHNTIRTYITKEGTYTKDLEGITVLRVGNVILEGLKNTSDLVIGDGVGEDPVKITNVNIEKRLLVRGGKITLQNTTVGEYVVVNNVNGITYFNNYNSEIVFYGMAENTEARFKERESGGGVAVTKYDVTFYLDDVLLGSLRVKKNKTIGSNFPEAPIGYLITGWEDESGNPVTADTVVKKDIRVNAIYELIEYDLSFVDADGNAISFITSPEATFNVVDGYTLPTEAQIDMSAYLGYSFEGWKDAATGVTIASYDDLKNLLTRTTTGITLKAVFTLNHYPIAYKNEDGTAFSYWADGYAPEPYYDIKTPYVLPVSSNVSRLGYTLTGWKDAEGNEITTVTVTDDSSLTEAYVLYPIFTLHEYNIEYVFEAGAGFVAGFDKLETYGPGNTLADILPLADKVSPAAGRYFLCWIDQATGATPTELPLYYVDGTTLVLEAVFDSVPPTYYTVRFFEGYNQDEDFLLGKYDNVVSGTSVAAPEIGDSMYRTGHKKNSSIASVYATEEKHIIKPTYWYVDDTNKLVPFTSEVKIVKDTDVYLLYKNFTTSMSIGGQDFSVTASYEHSTRLLNSMKDMALIGRQQLDKALQLGVISGLDEKAIEKLIAANILDSGKNIQKIKLPLAIGKFVKRDTINGSIKQFIRDTINNDAKLDSILDMIDIDQFIADININQMVKDMTDEELRDLIKDDTYKGDVVDFILDDLEKSDSKMLDAVVDHIMNDSAYKNDLIEEIIAKLKAGTAEDSIIESIKDSDNLLDMVIDALKNEDATLMPSAVSHIKTTLAADTDAGKNLRKTVLTGNKLKDILIQDAIKAKLLDMMTDVTFVNKAMEDRYFRVEIVEAIVNDDHFLEMLVGTDMFTEYVVAQFHDKDSDLHDDILALLASETKFKSDIIAEIKINDTFLNLIKEGGALRADVLAEIKFDDFVEDQDNFVAYVLGQTQDKNGNAIDGSKYTFITKNQIDDILENKYPELLWLGTFTARQNFLDDIYNDAAKRAEAKATIITEAQKEFDEYAESILDKLAKKETITDTKVNEVINDMLIEHITKYIDEEPEASTLNAKERQAIEDILVHYVGDVLCDETSTSVGTENEDLKAHVDALKLKLLEDDSKKDDVIDLIDDFIEEDDGVQARKILGKESTYAKVVDKLVALVKTEGNAVYDDVDAMLRDNIGSVSDDLSKDFIAQNAGSADLKSSIQTYIEDMENSTIATHIKNFMTDATLSEDGTTTKGEVNTATVRTEINNYLTAEKIEEYAEDFVKDPDNAEELEEEVTNFVSNISVQFVTDNRATIEEALTDMDLSGLVDKETVKDHIAGLSPEEKQKFADKIYGTLIKTDNVKTFIDSLLNDETFEVTEDNLSIIKAIAEALRSFEYEDIMEEINNATIKKVIDVVGEDFIKEQFNTIIGDYCDGLDEVIAQVEADKVTKEYTTSLTIVIDIINDLYKPLYDKAQSKVENKIQNVFGIDFTKNPYIKFLVEDDITARFFDGDSSLATDESTGYAIRDILDYYDYLYMLLLVADDAACWYGIDENVSDEEIDAIYEAMTGKVVYAHSKLNEILETYLEEDKLPARVESILQNVQQLNNAFMKVEPTLKKSLDKYLKSSINEGLENGDVPGVEKGEKLIDILIGQEEPVINIDTIYNVFYYYDDTIQDKLASVVESDKFKAAVEKFESSSIGRKFLGNGKIQDAYDSVYDLFVDIAKDGIEQFRIEEDVITTEDAYRVKVGDVVIIIKRYYE